MTTLASSTSVSVRVGDNGTASVATAGGTGTVAVTPTTGSTQTYSLGPFPERRRFGPFSEGALVTFTNGTCASFDYDYTSGDTPGVQALLSNGTIQDNAGGVYALSEVSSVQTLTATGTAQTGAGYFRGITVRAISGTPQTVTVYDATSATGTAIAVFTVSAVGTFYWDGDWATPGNGRGARRSISTGCHVVISGGTSRTIDVMVEAS